MREFNIGLDFGTSQSKVCVYSIDSQTHEFVKFGDQSFFIPSKVFMLDDGRFRYGNYTGDFKESYSYFKIASAEDEIFHLETYEKNTDEFQYFYKFNEYKNYSPELLSALYLTFVLFTVKEKYRKNNVVQKPTGGLLSRILNVKDPSQEAIKFTVQLGIPTEWSQEKNRLRKRKFENILLLSEILQEYYKTLDNYLESNIDNLIENVKIAFNSYSDGDEGTFDQKLNTYGVSVFPETAAGLYFILKTRQLGPGFYSIIDIGGGSTDLSFFQVMTDNSIKYLASESYMIASNNVFKELCAEKSLSKDLYNAEQKVLQLIDNEQITDDIKKIIIQVNKKLEKLVYKLFNNRVYYFMPNMARLYKYQPIIFYGGGAKLFYKSGNLTIFDNGVRGMLNDDCYTDLEKHELQRFAKIIEVLPTDNTWQVDFSILVVSLGLSFIKSAKVANWFNETDYHKYDKDNTQRILVQHPRNEDCYIYDVIEKEWK